MARIALIDVYNREENSLGEEIAEQLTGHGHKVTRERLKSDLGRLKGLLIAALADPRFDTLLLVGDLPRLEQEALARTVEGLLDRRLPGFDTLARHLRIEQEGSDLLFSWFVAGAHGQRLLLAIPGNKERLSDLLDRLVIPQLASLLEWVG